MKYSFSLLISLFFCVSIYSQEYSINLYSNWYDFPSHIMTNKVDYSGLSVSYKKMNRNLIFQEFELKPGMRFPQSLEFSTTKVYNHVRYELGKQIFLGSSEKFAFEYGAGAKLFNFYTHEAPKTTDLYKANNNIIGFGTALLTGINYNFTDKFYVQLKGIFVDLTIWSDSSFTDDPGLPENLRRNINFNFDLTLIKGLRLGVGYKIGKQHDK